MKKILTAVLALVMALSLAACGSKPAPAPEASGSTSQQEQGAQSSAASSEQGTPADSSEAVNVEDLQFGLEERGEDIIQTIMADTPLGEIACVMTYDYEDGTLEAVTADYYTKDASVAADLAEELCKNDEVVPDSVVCKGDHVSCKLSESTVDTFRSIDRSTLLSVLGTTA